MKKYRLKEEVKKYFHIPKVNDLEPRDLDNWQRLNISLEALEEVPQRVELYNFCTKKDSCGITRVEFTTIENINYLEIKNKIEKAVNNELLDIDSLDDDDFYGWYSDMNNSINPSTNWEFKGIKEVLKQYLKEKK